MTCLIYHNNVNNPSHSVSHSCAQHKSVPLLLSIDSTQCWSWDNWIVATLTSQEEGCWLDPGDRRERQRPEVDRGKPASFRQTSQKCHNPVIGPFTLLWRMRQGNCITVAEFVPACATTEENCAPCDNWLLSHGFLSSSKSKSCCCMVFCQAQSLSLLSFSKTVPSHLK